MDTAQGPNEKKTLSYPDAIINLQLANAEEKGLIWQTAIGLQQVDGLNAHKFQRVRLANAHKRKNK